MIPRFQFHGEAIGLSGQITLPFNEVIPVQAGCVLPESGGYGSARVDAFRHRELVSARSAFSQVAGAYSDKDKTFDMLATVTVEDLNILNVVTADAVVMRIASSHPDDPLLEPSITPVGSHFVGLRIGGQPLECDLAHDSYAKFDTYSKVRLAYQNNQDNFRTEFNAMTLWGQASAIPAKLRVHFPWSTVALTPPQFPATRWLIPSTLVRNVRTPAAPLVRYGHVIVVPGFGVVRLAEIKISQKRLRVTMLRVNFGSIPEGELICATGEGNGSDW